MIQVAGMDSAIGKRCGDKRWTGGLMELLHRER